MSNLAPLRTRRIPGPTCRCHSSGHLLRPNEVFVVSDTRASLLRRKFITQSGDRPMISSDYDTTVRERRERRGERGQCRARITPVMTL